MRRILLLSSSMRSILSQGRGSIFYEPGGSNLLDHIQTGNSNEEIYKYFPDIFYNIKKQKFLKIPEGVEFKKSCHKFEVMPKAYYILLNKGLEYHLSEENLKEKPVIINVGRFDPLKGQHILAKTWSSSRLSDEYDLVLIGGNIKSPDKNEKIVLEEIKKNLKGLREKEAAVLTGALENGIIRCLENSIIMNLVHETPHMYICSSYKEEFGISILEAMSAGFLIFAPRRGGVKGYIKNGENGFLINTNTADSIKEEVLIVLDSFKPKRLREIAEKGRQTVFDNFSIESIAKKYKKLYET
ncbi:MAG: glycosyltransferase family 4 protein [Kosmotoga sp.]|nr:MAG: glycosyltransferase family 4 protein [Kosmotoga sp.]